MRRGGAGRIGAALLLLASAGALSGCVAACPAIGWVNTVRVEVLGDDARLATIEPCVPDAEACGGPLVAAQRDEDGTWTVDVDMNAPERIVLRALDAEGTVLAETEMPLDWQRVGGSARCGGPAEAQATLELDG